MNYNYQQYIYKEINPFKYDSRESYKDNQAIAENMKSS